MAKILPLSQYTKPSGKIVAISGCFDILHIGHIRFIEAAKRKGDMLVVLVESDEFIKKYKLRSPFHSQVERAEILGHMRDVDVVVMLPFMTVDETYPQMWKKISPEIIALTQDDTYLDEKKVQAKAIGAEVVEVIPLIKGKSSTVALTHHPQKNVLD